MGGMKKIRIFDAMTWCLLFGMSLMMLAHPLPAATSASAPIQVTAVRVWPAQDYTRIAFESAVLIKHQMMVLKNPDRLVLDLEGVALDASLKSLTDKVLSSDPYIKQVRLAQFKANVVRVAIDLKSEVKPNLFALQPAGDYKHRLVLDIYPLQDTLMALLEKKGDEQSQEINATVKPIVEPLPPVTAETEESTPDATVTPSKSDAAKPAESKSAENKPRLDKTMQDKPVNDNKPLEDKSLQDKSLQDKPTKSKENERIITIAIDAGHGGEDPGAHGANGTREKDVTLSIAKKFKEKVDAEPNMRGVLTRDGDYFVPLGMRVVKARKLQADLFVSIHADASPSQSARGSSVFALSEKGATSASARYLAKKENESDLIGGVSLGGKDNELVKTLLDLSQAATINDSLKLGKSVLGHIGNINKLHKKQVEQAGFAVLKSPDIPSILVETAFISNPDEEAKLADEEYQAKLADAILAGVKKYFSGNPALAKTKVAKE
jgi:N-acetylmuramoyl-L-alanine amidase